MFQVKVLDKVKTHILCPMTFVTKIVSLMRRGKMFHSRTGHTWQYNTAHALCMLDNKGYRRTHTHTRNVQYLFIALPK